MVNCYYLDVVAVFNVWISIMRWKDVREMSTNFTVVVFSDLFESKTVSYIT